MTNQHRATIGYWVYTKMHADRDPICSCILELRDRVEAMEATKQARVEWTAPNPYQDKLDRLIALDRDDDAPAGSLVERVAAAIDHANKTGDTDARAAIREVAAWLRERTDGYASDILDDEASQ